MRRPASPFSLHASYSVPWLHPPLQAAEDFRVDPQLDQYCKGDVSKFCADVTPGEGRTQDCLVGCTLMKRAFGCYHGFVPDAAAAHVGCS